MKLTGLYFVICILWKEILAESSTISLDEPARTDYFDGLINYLKNESKLYRVLFILEDLFENTDPMLNSLMMEVNQNFPSLSISYNNFSTWDERHTKYDKWINYRSTTLFVFQVKSEETIRLVRKNLSTIGLRNMLTTPRCLIMNSNNATHKYSEYMMSNFFAFGYFDFTIMTYNEKVQGTPSLHYINSLTKTLTTQDITAETQWFPDKVNNLKSQKLGFHFDATNSNNDNKQMDWMQKRTTEIFARAFNTNPKQGNVIFPPYLRCHLQYPYMPNTHNLLRIQKIDVLKAVIPKTKKNTNDLVFSPQILQMILGTVGMIIIFRFIYFFMNFKRETWETLNIVQIIIGMPANQEPNSWLEKIVFGSLLITCIFYTGFIYSVVLDISIQPEPEISSLEELANSSLLPLIDQNFFNELNYSAAPPYIKKLFSNPLRYSFLHRSEECLEYLIRYKNISCIIPDAENYVNSYLSLKGKDVNVKILPETVTYHYILWNVHERRVFMDFFDKIILRATEFGLFDKVYCVKNLLPGKISPPEEIKQDKLFFIISHVLGIGYTISIIIFLLELFTRNFRNRLNAFYTSFRLGN